MIACNEQDCLMPISLGGSSVLPSNRHPTLTEVATLAIYGSCLTTSDMHSASALFSEETRALWRIGEDGLKWIEPNLEALFAIEQGKLSADALTCDEDLASALRGWLNEKRKYPLPERYSATVREKSAKLAAMTNLEALEFAQSEINRRNAVAAELNERTRRFYKVLSQLAVMGRIALKGVQEYRHEQSFSDRPALPFGHRGLDDNDLIPDLGHSLFSNIIEIDPPRGDHDIVGWINRRERQKHDLLIDWTDVRLSPTDAQLVMAQFESEGALADSEVTSQQAAMPINVTRRRRYELTDAPLRKEMLTLLEEGKASSVENAAGLVASRAEGVGVLESKIERLARFFREDHPEWVYSRETPTRKKSA